MKFIDWISSPKIAGLIGMLGTGLFVLVATVLFFVTPGYNIVTATVSALALGAYGDVYTFFLYLFSMSMFILGLGLSRALEPKWINPVLGFFSAFMIGTFIVAYFKMDLLLDEKYTYLPVISLSGKIHFYTTLSALFLYPAGVLFLIKEFKKNTYWIQVIPYSWGVLLSGFVMGAIWFIFFQLGLGYSWKGLFQKVIIFDLMVWCFLMSYWLYRTKTDHA